MSQAPEPAPDSRSGSRPEPTAPGGGVYEWFQRGLELLRAGSPAAAVHLLERAAEAEPDSRSVWEALGRAQFDSGRYTEAATSFGHIVSAAPSDDYARFGLGLALMRSGDVAAAVEHLALAVAMRPEVKHYSDALKGARATLRARADAVEPES